jgi:hypothetical protein
VSARPIYPGESLPCARVEPLEAAIDQAGRVARRAGKPCYLYLAASDARTREPRYLVSTLDCGPDYTLVIW